MMLLPRTSGLLHAAAMCAAVVCTATPVQAEPAPVSFAGKQIRVSIGFSPTGFGYDTYGRLLARHTIEIIALALAGLLAATRRPGWQVLGLLTGATLIYLGLAAAKLPTQAGGWGAAGAALATLGGWAFVGVTVWEARRAGKQCAKWNSATSLISK